MVVILPYYVGNVMSYYNNLFWKINWQNEAYPDDQEV